MNRPEWPLAQGSGRRWGGDRLYGLNTVLARPRAYWALVKSLQTGLLAITGLAGYLSAHPAKAAWPQLGGLAASLPWPSCW